MTKLRLALAAFVLIAFGSFAIGQGVGGVGFWPNWPIVGQSSYCLTTTNGVCTATIPAGPSVLTGSETIPANTGSTSGPANVLISVGALNALPITITDLTTAAASAASISASNVMGGIVLISGGTMAAVNISLPPSPVNGQQFAISANRTITALSVAVTPGSGDTVAGNSAPTVLTANTTGGPQGYRFIYNLSGTQWLRLQ